LTKKTLAMSLIIFIILPVISLAGEIEIGDVKLEWREDFATAWTFWAKIPVTNYANYEYRVIGKLLFSDENGYCKGDNLYSNRECLGMIPFAAIDFSYPQFRLDPGCPIFQSLIVSPRKATRS